MSNRQERLNDGVSNEPTDEIRGLLSQDWYLKQTNRGELCSNSPMNFIGALILERKKRTLLELSKDIEKKDLQARLSHPISIEKNVPLYNPFPTEEISPWQVDAKMTAPKVLVKRECGVDAGLIIEGPLTGTMLHVRMLRDGTRYVINTLWHDDGFTAKYPYGMPFPLQTKFDFTILGHKKYEDMRDFFKETYDSLFEYRNVHSQALVSLCRLLKIPLDRKNFHRSIPDEDGRKVVRGI